MQDELLELIESRKKSYNNLIDLRIEMSKRDLNFIDKSKLRELFVERQNDIRDIDLKINSLSFLNQGLPQIAEKNSNNNNIIANEKIFLIYENINTIRRYISEADLEKVFILLENLKIKDLSEYSNEIISHQAKLKSHFQKNRLQIISDIESQLEENKLIYNILTFLSTIENFISKS